MRARGLRLAALFLVTELLFRPVLVFDRRAKGKARDFNWHHVFGFWMAIPLALVVGSATVISFPWASDLAYRAIAAPHVIVSSSGWA